MFCIILVLIYLCLSQLPAVFCCWYIPLSFVSLWYHFFIWYLVLLPDHPPLCYCCSHLSPENIHSMPLIIFSVQARFMDVKSNPCTFFPSPKKVWPLVTPKVLPLVSIQGAVQPLIHVTSHSCAPWLFPCQYQSFFFVCFHRVCYTISYSYYPLLCMCPLSFCLYSKCLIHSCFFVHYILSLCI